MGNEAMTEPSKVAAQYSSGSLLDRIEAGLRAYGARHPLSLKTLSLFDEFHIGGRAATESFLQRLQINAGSRVLDMGCGIGGPARFIAKTTGARVTGIDLTEEFVAAGRALTGQAVMLDVVDIIQGSILDMPFDDDRFDVVYMIHVGMNVDDKEKLAAEAARVLKPGGIFGIYDIMAVDDGQITYPVPWASSEDHNALSRPQVYRDALIAAGFRIISQTDRTEMAKAFFAQMAEKAGETTKPPPLGLHLIMGPDAPAKVRNMVMGIHGGQIAPVEIIARLLT